VSPIEPKSGDIPIPKNTVEGTGSIGELQRRRGSWNGAWWVQRFDWTFSDRFNCRRSLRYSSTPNWVSATR
jgi:hypothetical protein